MKKEIQLSEHFSYTKLLRFTLPSIVMMVFTSLYMVVDGVFVSNYVGKTAFAAINLIMPFLMMFASIGFMVGTGGSALVAKTLGEGKREKANSLFSMLLSILFICGIVLAIIGIAFIDEIILFLGAEGEMIKDCRLYALWLLPVLPAYLLQSAFQAFFVAAERPKIGMIVTLAAGATNIVLDYLFIVVFDWGLIGAAFATTLSQCVGGLYPLLYFAFPNKSLLHLTKWNFDSKALSKTCLNGSSELVTNISMSLVVMLYNFQLIKYIGEDGVAAFGVIMYVSYIFISLFLGYSIGSAPIVSFNYGAENKTELSNVYNKSIVIIIALSLFLTLLAYVLSSPLSKIFVGYDQGLYSLTLKGFRIYSLSFLLAGMNICASAFFTALNNGIISACISFSRTLIFETSAVIFIPLLFGIDGIWSAIIFAECASLLLVLLFIKTNRKKYGF